MSAIAAVPTGSGVDPCCCGTGCCMYPASGVSSGDILLADLPDAITVNAGGFSGTMNKGSETGGWYVSAPWFIDLDENLWKLYSAPGVISAVIGPCLITGDGNLTPGDDSVEDQFAGTLLIAGEYHNSSTGLWEPLETGMDRLSLCCWEVVLDGFIFAICYGYHADYGRYGFLLSGPFGDTIMDDPQSSPLGTYPDSSAFRNMVVTE